MARRSYAGGAQPTTIANSINTTSTVVSGVALIGWPNPTAPFFAVIDRDTPDEEKVLCTGVNGNDVTVIRGQDGTTARDHSAGAPFEHCFTATDADEANDHVNNNRAHGVPVGDNFAFVQATQTLTNKTMSGASNSFSDIPMAAVDGLDAALDGALNDLNAYLPVGSITMFGGDTPPSGWLLCDGSVLTVAAYPDLAQVLSSKYGGDGTNTFGLPNMSGRFPVGLSGDVEFNALGKTGGVKTVALTEAQMPAHVHGLNNHTHAGPSHTHAGPSHTHGSAAHSHGMNHNHILDFQTSGSSVASVGKGGGGSAATNGGPVSGPKLSGSDKTSTDSTTPAATGAAGTGATTASGTGATSAPSTADTTSKGSGAAHDNLPPYLTINFMIRALKAT